MSAVIPPAETKNRQQHQPAAAFEVDFEGVREAFEESSSSSRGGSGALSVRSVAGVGAAALAPLVMGAAEASAKGGEFGIIEGRSASFFHPIIMVSEGPIKTTKILQRQLCACSSCRVF